MKVVELWPAMARQVGGLKVQAIDVWGWEYSDFLSNAQRGVLAE